MPARTARRQSAQRKRRRQPRRDEVRIAERPVHPHARAAECLRHPADPPERVVPGPLQHDDHRLHDRARAQRARRIDARDDERQRKHDEQECGRGEKRRRHRGKGYRRDPGEPRPGRQRERLSWCRQVQRPDREIEGGNRPQLGRRKRSRRRRPAGQRQRRDPGGDRPARSGHESRQRSFSRHGRRRTRVAGGGAGNRSRLCIDGVLDRRDCSVPRPPRWSPPWRDV